ncbi:MAG: hypothetical protein B6245_14555 [Desulfobacteraceae bacterium 4572_88]|nr:MAG: hypothetical protein B6245_14555 [Desulfobacteraceae bacterium 4572_88]
MTDNSDAFDIIREIMNIGIGEAADALSKLINARVTIKIPDVRIMQTRDVHKYIRDALESLGFIFLRISPAPSRERPFCFTQKPVPFLS